MAAIASPNYTRKTPAAGPQDILFTCIVVLFGVALYGWHVAPTVRYWDAAERTLVAWQLGLSHPTGCVLHAVFGKVFMMLVPLPPEFSANLFSAFVAALALGVAYRLARCYSANAYLCFATTLVLATSALYWSQAIYSEVYALHFLFFTVFMFFYLRWIMGGTTRDLIVAAFVYTLGLGVHMSHILLAPWILIGVFQKERSIFRSPKKLLAITGAALLGMTWIAAIVIRGKTYWLLGTAERPDTITRLFDFLSGAQFAWARHPPTQLFFKRVAGCVALLTYSFMGVGAFIAFSGWIRTLRRHTALAILATGGSMTYILYFCDNSTSDVGTLILPCCLFVFLYFIISWENWATTVAHKRVAFVAVGLLAFVQWAVFPVLARIAEGETRRMAERGVLTDNTDAASAFLWEGVLKAKVSFRNDFEPKQSCAYVSHLLEHYPAPKVLIAPWAVQTVLAYYQATEGWPRGARLYETIDDSRFYRPQDGSDAEVFEQWRDVVKEYAGKRPVFLLNNQPQIGISMPNHLIAKIWFDEQYYYLYRITPHK